MPSTKPRTFRCEQCEQDFVSTPRRVSGRKARLGQVLCITCIKARHDAVLPLEEGYLPSNISQAGKQRTDRTTLKCEVCATSWETDYSSAQILFKKNNRRTICTHCQYDAKEWAVRVEVICETCGKPYLIDTNSKTMKSHGLHRARRCESCRVSGRTVSPEARAKISQKNIGRRLSAEDYVRKSAVSSRPDLVERLIAVNHLSPRFSGHTHTEEAKQKLREKNTGYVHTPEARADIAKGRRAYIDANGGTLPEETKRKIGATITQMRMDGFKPESGHVQEVYLPKKAQPVFLSPRATPYTLSSSWESVMARWLDLRPEVLAWSYECMKLTLRDGSSYLVDFVFTTANGTTIAEVKPARKIERNVDRAREKVDALMEYCIEHNAGPLIADELVIAEMRRQLTDELRAEIDGLSAQGTENQEP